ncbi:MAG: DUF4199 domain-containing protein [Saprospiraceae bacterium]|nr:DUF4199 domain-containing protein [Saprospiraceae bacterium]
MDLQKSWMKYGLMLGLISIIISLVSFYIFPIGMWSQMGLGLIIMAVFMVLASRDEKKLNNGILSYSDALKCTFFTGLVSTLASGIFAIILMQLIDPGLADVLKEQAMESTRSMMEKFGASEDVIQESMDKTEESLEKGFTVGSQIINLFTSVLFVLIIAAILSLFVKKDEVVME